MGASNDGIGKLWVQLPGKWCEAEIRGWQHDRMWVQCSVHRDWGDGIIEISFKELNERGFTSCTCGNHTSRTPYFTEDAKVKVDAKIADILANPMKVGSLGDKGYLWSYGQTLNKKTGKWSKAQRWQKHPILGWTEHWIFLKVDWTSADNEKLGHIVWVDRDQIKRKGSDWADHGHFYTKEGMAKEMQDREERAAKAARDREEQRKKAESDFAKAHRRYSGYRASYDFSHIVHAVDDAKLLNVTLTATKEEILASFKNLAKVHHPDKGGDLVKFQNISAAKDRMMKRFGKDHYG